MSILLIDLYQIFYSTMMHSIMKKGVELDENLYRHMVLNTIRANRVKFKDYKEVILATDSHSWRKDVFEFYKANRKTSRDKTDVDWQAIFNSLHKIRDELRDNFPYRVINVYGAEADDIISWVCRNNPDKDIMIVSGDHDFVQLQTNKKVKQWDPVRKKFLTEQDPMAYLLEHIFKGDSGDGIPNVLSDDDTFVNVSKRQTPLTKKKIRELLALDKDDIPNYNRNKVLIDLTQTPIDIGTKIYEEFSSQEGKGRSKMFNYFIQNRLNNLLPSIQEF